MRSLFLGLLFLVSLPAAAVAQNITAQDPQSIIRALQDYGVAATLTETTEGAPLIDTKLEGLFVTVYFYDCDDAKTNCQNITFEAIFNMTNGYDIQLANDWNSNNRFASSYRDQDGAAVLVTDVNLSNGGMSPDLFRDVIEWWDDSLIRFKEHINF